MANLLAMSLLNSVLSHYPQPNMTKPDLKPDFCHSSGSIDNEVSQ